MAGFVLYGGLPVSSLTTKAGLVRLRAGPDRSRQSRSSGLVTQATLKVVAYFVGGFAKVFPMAAGDNIDLKKYSPKIDLER
jgi:hypothetical protein